MKLRLLLLLLLPPLGLAAPVLEQTDLFVAGQDGIFEYRIPVLVTSTKGTLIACCDGRMKREGDPPNDIDLVMKRSTDGGKTWGPLVDLVNNGAGAVADSCGIVDQQTGTVWIFSVYAPEGIGSANAEPGLSGPTFQYKAIKSDDDGLTWSKPIDFTGMVKAADWAAGSTGVGRGMQMRNGRLIFPRYFADYHEPRTTPTSSNGFVCYSDDHGKTWKMGALTQAPGGTNECQAVELSNGDLMLNLRSLNGNHRKVAISHDGGATWAETYEDKTLLEPRCQGSIQRLTEPTAGNAGLILFANPASLKRLNLTIRVSADDGNTWSAGRSLHAGPSAYSCLTTLPDGSAACLYEAGDHPHEAGGKGPYEKITFARFNLEWVNGGKN